jgi:hypothetical protein
MNSKNLLNKLPQTISWDCEALSCYVAVPAKRTGLNHSHIVLLSLSRIHERTISLRFLGIILIVLRLKVSAYNVCITNQFKQLLLKGEIKPVSRGDCE